MAKERFDGRMFWEKDAETMSRAKIRQLQLERLKWTINRCYNNVPYYKDMLDKAGVTPDMIKTLDDIRRLPLTTKEELRKLSIRALRLT